MSLKSLVLGGIALSTLMAAPAFAADGWTGLDASPGALPSVTPAPVFDPAAPRGQQAVPGVPPVANVPQPVPGASPQAAPFGLAPAAPAAPAQGGEIPPPAGTQIGSGVDESALRYYASRNDVARVAAEIRRLRALHPEWQPPEDLFSNSTGPGVDLQPLWALFGAGRYDEMRSAIEQLKLTNPGFQPPEEMLKKLDEAQATAYLVQASDAGDDGRVLAIARNYPGIMVCDRIDVLWRVAESLARTGELERSFSAYDYILTTCEGGAERVATVQKASQLLPETAVLALMSRGKVRMDGTNEFDVVMMDFTRRRVGEAIPNAELTPADPADLTRLANVARLQKSIGDANLLGWYHFARKEFDEAETWFRTAKTFGDDPKTTEGLILTLRSKGDLAGAEAMAFDARETTDDIKKAFVDVVSASLTEKTGVDYPEDRLTAFAEAVDELKSDVGAQSLGWYLFNHDKFAEAAPWFDKSMEWKASGEAALGQVLSAQRLKDSKKFKDLVAQYAEEYPAVKALQTAGATVAVNAGEGKVRVSVKRKKPVDTSLAREALALYESKRYREAIDRLEKIKASGRETQDLAVLRGWAYYNIRQFNEAREIFRAADAKKSTSDTRTGLFYSNKMMRAPLYQR